MKHFLIILLLLFISSPNVAISRDWDWDWDCDSKLILKALEYTIKQKIDSNLRIAINNNISEKKISLIKKKLEIKINNPKSKYKTTTTIKSCIADVVIKSLNPDTLENETSIIRVLYGMDFSTDVGGFFIKLEQNNKNKYKKQAFNY